MDKEKILQIQNKLIEAYPDAGCALGFRTPYELLVATILSAQCTDIRVNKVTARLFEVADTPEKMLRLGEENLLGYIKSCGLGNSKAGNIISMSKDLCENFNSEVPDNFEALTSLAGVGRKTANVVMANAFGIPSFAVDTHVHRVTNRIGLVNSKTAEQTEKQIRDVIDEDKWILMHHVFIFHGRQICHARKPDCAHCIISDMCEKNMERKKTI